MRFADRLGNPLHVTWVFSSDRNGDRDGDGDGDGDGDRVRSVSLFTEMFFTFCGGT